MAKKQSNGTRNDFPTFTLCALVFGLGAPLAVSFVGLTAGADIVYGEVAYGFFGDLLAKIIGVPLSVVALIAKEKLPLLAALALVFNLMPSMVIMHLLK